MIELKHVSKEFVSSKKYPGFKGAIKGLFSNEKVKKVAVDDISFTINDGEIVGYIGSNGAGKSTTIKMMTGILNPTSGTCLVSGNDPSKNRKDNAQNIGVVFGQRTQLWWDLPLSESFTILKEIYDVSDEAYEEQMKFLNLSWSWMNSLTDRFVPFLWDSVCVQIWVRLFYIIQKYCIWMSLPSVWISS